MTKISAFVAVTAVFAGAFTGIALLIFATRIAAPPAMAQSGNGGPSRLDAYACEKLPASLRIDVQILDNAARYLRLRDKFIARINKDGIEVVAGAPLVLMLDIKTVREFEEEDKRHIGELRVGGSGGVSLRGNIWSNTDDSVLGGRKKSADRTTVDRLQVTANLNRRDDGRCMWRGEILHDLQGGDPDHAAFQIMPILAGAIGQSIRNKPVIIPD